MTGRARICRAYQAALCGLAHHALTFMSLKEDMAAYWSVASTGERGGTTDVDLQHKAHGTKHMAKHVTNF